LNPKRFTFFETPILCKKEKTQIPLVGIFKFPHLELFNCFSVGYEKSTNLYLRAIASLE
jgi:hypothetical protein